MPEISVIMGVYNELNKDILMEAVNSILHQTFEDFEFIIYDDGSCPEAATLLREVAGLDERIKLIGQDENHGLAFSLNECIDEANLNLLKENIFVEWMQMIFHIRKD